MRSSAFASSVWAYKPVGTAGAGTSCSIGGIRSGPAVVQRTTAARSPIHASGLPVRPHAARTRSASVHVRSTDDTADDTTPTAEDRAKATASATLVVVIRSLPRAAIAAFGPAALAAVVGPLPPASWLVAALALPLGLVTRPRTRGAWGPWIVGVVLAVVAALAAGRARGLAEVGAADWPAVDLAVAAMPTPPPEYVAVTGVLRAGIVLDEYDVPQGAIPDQSQPAKAVLVPLAPSDDPEVAMRGPLVVVRVRASEAAPSGRSTWRGRTEVLPPELLATLLDLAGAGDRPTDGVLVDTLRVPGPREAWTAGAVAALLALLAAIAHALAVRASSR